jgi:HEAT repeat protein
MSSESKTPPAGKPAAAKSAPPKDPAPAAPATPPPLDERRLKYSEIAPHAKAMDPAELVAMLRDGRGIVRANAALALAAGGHALPDLVPLLRDSESSTALAVAEALARLGTQIRPLVPDVVKALDNAHPDVLDTVTTTLCDLIGRADDELIAALDVPNALAMASVVRACGKAGRTGIALLARATTDERGRIRINACDGLGRLGKIDPDVALAALSIVEAGDPVPDARTGAKAAMLAVVAREKQAVVDRLPKNIPDFEERKLSASELAEHADAIDVDEMIYALQDGRAHVKINAARCLAVVGTRAGRAAAAMGLNLKDSVVHVRRETAKALGKLGTGALGAAAELVHALGDVEDDVAEAASETLASLGEAARDALVKGLETGSEAGGFRAGGLIARLPGASETLTEAFRSPAVNVQVNAALGLGQLGANKLGAGLEALHGARTGGDARTRAAVFRALEMLFPKGDTGPKSVTIDGFEDRYLSAAEVEKGKADIEKVGVADLVAHLQNGRDTIRANAATALGVLGPAAAGVAAQTLGVRLRDDAPRVRLAAASALDKLGDAAVIATADDLVGALGDTDEGVARAVAGVIKARKARMIGALVRGMETDKPNHGRRIAELINVFEDAPEILCDAFESPAVNVQVNAALGLGMLGKARVGKGRKALEGARTGGWERTRIAVFEALAMLDGPPKSGPEVPAVDGFETKLLGAEAFTDAAKLVVGDLIGFLQDGRPVVRANTATALGTLGAAAMPAVNPLGVLLRDDDSRVRIAAATALDKLGDDAVREIASYLVGALRGDAEVAKVCARVLTARKARVLTALLKGFETDDPTHAVRIAEVVNALPDACEILCDAFESPAENVQVNVATAIGMLGAKRAGNAGRRVLEGARTGGFARTRESVFKALAMLDDKA